MGRFEDDNINLDELNLKDIRYTTAYIVDDEKAIDLDNHRINFVVSSDVIDRSGESVLAEAVYKATQQKDEFRENPVCLIAHRHHLNTDEPPSIGTWDVSTAKQRKHHVEMFLQFDTELKLGNKYWIAYKNKTMRAVSIGFRIKNYRVEEVQNRRVLIITEIELIEISVCAVGCNQQALAKLKQLGLVETKDQLMQTEIVTLTDRSDKTNPQSLIDAVVEKVAALIAPLQDDLDELKTLITPGAEDDFSLPPTAKIPAGTDDTGETFVEKINSAFEFKDPEND